MQQKIELIVATLFLARDVAHRAHLKTQGPGSLAKHLALEEFYNSVVDLADTLTETYQGCFDVLLDIPLLNHDGGEDITQTLQAQRQWIRECRYEAVPKEETPIHNIIDEIEALYMRTNFKLNRLA